MAFAGFITARTAMACVYCYLLLLLSPSYASPSDRNAERGASENELERFLSDKTAVERLVDTVNSFATLSKFGYMLLGTCGELEASTETGEDIDHLKAKCVVLTSKSDKMLARLYSYVKMLALINDYTSAFYRLSVRKISARDADRLQRKKESLEDRFSQYDSQACTMEMMDAINQCEQLTTQINSLILRTVDDGSDGSNGSDGSDGSDDDLADAFSASSLQDSD